MDFYQVCFDKFITSRAALRRSISRFRIASFSISLRERWVSKIKRCQPVSFRLEKVDLAKEFCNFPFQGGNCCLSLLNRSSNPTPSKIHWLWFPLYLQPVFLFIEPVTQLKVLVAARTKCKKMPSPNKKKNPEKNHPRSSALSLAWADSPKEAVYLSFQSASSPSYLDTSLLCPAEMSPVLQSGNVFASVLHLWKPPCKGFFRLL